MLNNKDESLVYPNMFRGDISCNKICWWEDYVEYSQGLSINPPRQRNISLYILNADIFLLENVLSLFVENP